MRLTDLTATEQLKQPALTSLVAKLEREGLVSRRPDPRDGRAVLLSLTPEGRRIVDSRRADRVARLRRLVGHLDGDDRAALADVMRVLGRLTEIAERLEDRP
jgi:DNA-binding MarR family transcriptional regulator